MYAASLLCYLEENMKILIVDDEYYTVQLIYSQLDWNLLGVNEILMAYNGEEAMRVFDEERPEIILCDIDMPKANGLEVLEYVISIDKNVQFIFLTCFNKFEYIQKAIHMGAADYLCKPFQEPDVYATVTQAVSKVKKQKKIGNLENQIENYQKKLEQEFIGDLIYGKIPSNRDAVQKILEREKYLYKTDHKYRLVLSCIFQKIPIGEKDESVYQFVFWNIVEEIFQGKIELLEGMPVKWNGIYGILMITEEDREIEQITESIYQLAEVAEQHLHMAFSSTVSEKIYLWEFSENIEKLKQQIDIQFLNSVKFSCMENEIGRTEEDGNYIDHKYVCKCLEQYEVNKIVEYLVQVMDNLQQEMKLTKKVMHKINTDITQIMYAFCYENGIAAHLLFQEKESEQMQKRAEQMPYYMIRFVELICIKIVDLLKLQTEEQILFRKIDEYIKEHFKEPIGRGEVAANLHYSQSYLSKIFRIKMNMSLRDYVNKYRIEEAKKRLSKTDDNIGDIAMDIGFESMAYFSTVFKKYCGMTPTQWRNRK